MHIHVGANIPGYVPESDVACFDDVESALEYLRQEIRDQQDYYYEGCSLYASEDTQAFESCECAWCDVAGDCEAALGAITDAAPEREAFVSEGRAAWIFSPPEGASMHHWAVSIETDRDSCEIAQEQGD